jgi:hypothetical protein
MVETPLIYLLPGAVIWEQHLSSVIVQAPTSTSQVAAAGILPTLRIHVAVVEAVEAVLADLKMVTAQHASPIGIVISGTIATGDQIPANNS